MNFLFRVDKLSILFSFLHNNRKIQFSQDFLFNNFCLSLSLQVDEEDADILALRDAALNSLKPKSKGRILENANPTFKKEHQIATSYPPVMHDNSPHNIPVNGISPINFAGHRPGFVNQTPTRQPIYNPGYHNPPMLPRPQFVHHPQPFPPRHPIMPVVQPHLNPNFIAHNPHPGRFIPAGPELPMHTGLLDEAMPLLPEQNALTFQPTPPSRLSPRSAM